MAAFVSYEDELMALAERCKPVAVNNTGKTLNAEIARKEDALLREEENLHRLLTSAREINLFTTLEEIKSLRKELSELQSEIKFARVEIPRLRGVEERLKADLDAMRSNYQALESLRQQNRDLRKRLAEKVENEKKRTGDWEKDDVQVITP